MPLPALHLSPPLGRAWHLSANEKKIKATKEGSRFKSLKREPKFTPKGSLALQTGSTTGQRTLMGNPVWIGLEAGIRCSACQCSKVWLFLRDHLRPRTFAFHLPRPDPVYKPTTLGSACHRPTPPSPSPPAASCILQTSSRGSHQALTRPQLRLVAAPAT